jgi:hypothetical protein
MPQRFFYIDEKKQQCLSATWHYNWSNFKLRLQDEVVCSFATKQELTVGRQFIMPDGHLLSVRLKGGVRPELELLRNGLPLPDNGKKLRSRHNTIPQLALFLGILNIIAGITAETTQSEIMLSIGFGYGSIVIGAAYMLLAWGIRHLPSFAGLAFAALFLVDMVLVFILTSGMEGPTSPISGLLIKFFLIYAFVRGTGAMKQLRTQTTESVA